MRTSLLLLALVGCGVEPTIPDEPGVEDGLVIASADAHYITGTYGENGQGLEFELENAVDFRFATVGARGASLLESVFHDQDASTTVLGRLTYVRTEAGLEVIGEPCAMDDFLARPEASLLAPLRIALRDHGIVDEIVTFP